MYSCALSRGWAGSWFRWTAVLPSGQLPGRGSQSRAERSRVLWAAEMTCTECAEKLTTLLIRDPWASIHSLLIIILPSSKKPGYLVFMPRAHTRKGWGESARGRLTVHNKKWQCPFSSKEGYEGILKMSMSSAVLAYWEQWESLQGENCHLQAQ